MGVREIHTARKRSSTMAADILSSYEVDSRTREYEDKLHALSVSLIQLYRAALSGDESAAEEAMFAVNGSLYEVPQLPPWPEAEAELHARLLAKFRPAQKPSQH
jgi:hypothetical protein